MSVSAGKRKRRAARAVAARKAPRRGLIVPAATAPDRAVFEQHAAPLSADLRAPRDGGRQTWHDSGDARPWRTSTAFADIRPRQTGLRMFPNGTAS